MKEIEYDGFITREADLIGSGPLEMTGEGTARPAAKCIYPKCEECDHYHGHYCTVPMVISKQIFIITEDKITDLMKRVLDLENLVYDEIIGDKDGEDGEP